MRRTVIAVFLLATTFICFSQNKITAEKIKDIIEIKINENVFSRYVMSDSEKYPYMFPLNGPSKGSVTSMRNADYPHHSSLFISCDRLNDGNYWYEGLERGQILSVRADIIESGGDKVVIENECIWRREGGSSPVFDKRRISVNAPSGKKTFVDFDIILTMLDDVTILKTGHSLFSARVAPDYAVQNGGKIVNAEGKTGEKETYGKKSAWVDYYGKRGGEYEGIAILQHPSNDLLPPWWTRNYGFFAPDPAAWPENGESLSFNKGESIKLRYRVIIHSGDTEEAEIAKEYSNYLLE
jgi:hypothetical protein